MKVELYTKPNCPFCVKTKAFLNMRNVQYEEKRLDIHFTREQLLEAFPSAKSYPVIVVDGFYIGGYTNLQEMLNEEQTTQQFLIEE